jgi:hypothetical protein
MSNIGKPNPENSFLSTHTRLIVSSYSRLIGKELLSAEYAHEDIPRALFEAPIGLVSHNTDPVPVFNYGNQAALAAFELDWSEFIQLASRDSAEPVKQTERELLMSKVK